MNFNQIEEEFYGLTSVADAVQFAQNQMGGNVYWYCDWQLVKAMITAPSIVEADGKMTCGGLFFKERKETIFKQIDNDLGPKIAVKLYGHYLYFNDESRCPAQYVMPDNELLELMEKANLPIDKRVKLFLKQRSFQRKIGLWN